eukprot:gb/GEZN01009187.1/.p1 GENE.gb/GEZN01009187.1/~~gb/GEZN01009187.1/.p1  ORF type:complete len:403 (-),score=36.65 gb/GEZN01009187.1/:64-1272(-)
MLSGKLTSSGLDDSSLAALVVEWEKLGIVHEELLLDMNDIQFEGLRALLVMLEARLQMKGGTRLRHLDLSMNPLYPGNESVNARKGLDGVCDLLRSKACPLHLSIRNIGLDVDEKAAAQLAQALSACNPGPIALDLSQNGLGDEGIAHFRAVVARNTSLRSLILRDNYFGDKGCASLAAALGENHSLTELVVCCNQITDKGAAAFSSALSTNRRLRLLDLSHAFGGFSSVESHITIEGAKEFARLFENKTCPLQVVKLNFQPLGLEGLKVIAASLRDNDRLRELQVKGCLEEGPVLAFQAALDRNTALSFVTMDSLEDTAFETEAKALTQVLRMNRMDFPHRAKASPMREILVMVLPVPLVQLCLGYLFHRPSLHVRDFPGSDDVVNDNFVTETLLARHYYN